MTVCITHYTPISKIRRCLNGPPIPNHQAMIHLLEATLATITMAGILPVHILLAVITTTILAVAIFSRVGFAMPWLGSSFVSLWAWFCIRGTVSLTVW